MDRTMTAAVMGLAAARAARGQPARGLRHEAHGHAPRPTPAARWGGRSPAERFVVRLEGDAAEPVASPRSQRAVLAAGRGHRPPPKDFFVRLEATCDLVIESPMRSQSIAWTNSWSAIQAPHRC